MKRFCLLAVGLLLAGLAAATPSVSAPAGFVTVQNGQFMLDGRTFRYGGTNNYYLHYKPQLMVDDVFADAAAMNLRVIRAWTFLECGSLDGTVPNSRGGCSQGNDYWMQRWDPATGRPIYNTGPNGLQKLDYMLAKANQTGIKLILPLTNNWPDFGGMDQYVTWYGLPYHDQFYTDPRIRQNYKDWASTLVNRVNSITGVRYRDDPAILAWELANEPRCINASLPSSGRCTTQTLVTWADEMSRHLKSIDPNHLVSVGDEGFLAWGRGADWPYNAADGVDHEALTRLPAVDFGTVHLYPDHWGRDAAWGTQWITDHLTAARGYGKPVVLEEFGLRDQAARDSVYRTWTETVRSGGGAGWNFWLLTGVQPDGSLYPDYDGFRVVHPSATATVLAEAARAIAGPGGPSPSPTASPTASPTVSPTSSPSPPPSGTCRVAYRVQNDWGTGFTANITITNTGAPVSGWTLGFSFGGNQRISHGWSATWSQSGNQVTARSLDWNAQLGTGASTTIGFNGTYSGGNPPPAAFTVNGRTCVVA